MTNSAERGADFVGNGAVQVFRPVPAAPVHSSGLRVAISPADGGVICAAVTGPLTYLAALNLGEQIEAAAGGVPAAIIVDMRNALLLFDPIRALNLCDRVSGVAALAAPIAVVAAYCPAGVAAWFELESARRGLVRRVFADVRGARRWASELAWLMRA